MIGRVGGLVDCELCGKPVPADDAALGGRVHASCMSERLSQRCPLCGSLLGEERDVHEECAAIENADAEDLANWANAQRMPVRAR